MRKVSLIKLILVLSLSFVSSSCIFDDDGGSSSGLNIAGTWRATVQVENCSPSDVCRDAGLQQGRTFNAVMVLRQDGDRVEGTYTYEGAGIEAEVEGRVDTDHVVLNGDAQNPFGRVTVGIVGFASESLIEAAVSHDVNVFDGRTGTVTGSGDFRK